MYLDYGMDADFDESANIFARQQRYRSRRSRLATGAIVGIAIACLAVVVFCLLCCYFCCLRKRRSKRAGAQPAAHTAAPGGGGGGGFLSGIMPGRKNHHSQPAYGGGPGMQQAGYGPGYGPGYGGQQQQQYGYTNGGVQPPPPTYR